MILFWKIIATGGGAGYSPWAPGTAGTALACLLLWSFSLLWPAYFSGIGHQPGLVLLIGIYGMLSLVAVHQLQPLWGKDPSRVVADEILGLWVAMIGVPVQWPYLLGAFALFRFFDILKPLGIRRAEALPGAWGVIADDVLAGIYTWLVLRAAILAGA